MWRFPMLHGTEKKGERRKPAVISLPQPRPAPIFTWMGLTPVPVRVVRKDGRQFFRFTLEPSDGAWTRRC